MKMIMVNGIMLPIARMTSPRPCRSAPSSAGAKLGFKRTATNVAPR